jgi:hypothetical protein
VEKTVKHFGSKNANPPRLIIFFGHYGASKSSISSQVSEHFQWPYYRYESLPYVATNKLSGIGYKVSEQREEGAWAEMESVLLDQLKAGLTLVIDTTSLTDPVWEIVMRFKSALPSLKILPVMMSVEEQTFLERSKYSTEKSASNSDQIDKWSEEDLMMHYKDMIEKRFPSLMVMDCNRPIDKIFKNTVSMFYGSIFQ